MQLTYTHVAYFWGYFGNCTILCTLKITYFLASTRIPDRYHFTCSFWFIWIVFIIQSGLHFIVESCLQAVSYVSFTFMTFPLWFKRAHVYYFELTVQGNFNNVYNTAYISSIYFSIIGDMLVLNFYLVQYLQLFVSKIITCWVY